jgi:hypothetical protein
MPKRSSIGDLMQTVEQFAGISRNSRSDWFEKGVAFTNRKVSVGPQTRSDPMDQPNAKTLLDIRKCY